MHTSCSVHTHVDSPPVSDKDALAQDPNYLPVPSEVHFPGDMTAMQIECGTFHTGVKFLVFYIEYSSKTSIIIIGALVVLSYCLQWYCFTVEMCTHLVITIMDN